MTSADAEPSGASRWDHKLWAIPVVVAMGLLSLLAVSYLGSVLDPERNLHDFPLVLVNDDRGEHGRAVADEIVAALPDGQVRLQVTDAAEAERQLSLGNTYGEIVIPADFSARLDALVRPAAERGTPPTVEVHTNPRAGTTAVTLTQSLINPALNRVNADLGARTLERARANGVPLSEAALVTLGTPLRVTTTPYDPLPEGTANGISAFYFTLLVVFAGFTSSMMVYVGVDTALADGPPVSRWRALLFKWALIGVVALVMAGLYQAIATGLGMPVAHHLILYCFSAFASLAIGMTALANLTVVASVATALRAPVLNTLGMPVNMLLFIALGLPSSGGIMPVQATPRPYGVLSRFEPMHQVFLGVRSILYFDARAAAGLTRAVAMCTLGVGLAVVLGVLATIGYDRVRAARHRDEPADETA
ncbi:DUF3533 domain-containing protein [Nocardia terpenica]|uniref:YhgE/Pip domain-containing protein n=1 Tax=Nocardia terpenica TaxID=455432 RepID=UPI002FE2B06F